MKKCTFFLMIFLIFTCLIPVSTFATVDTDILNITKKMENVGNINGDKSESGTRIKSIINTVIRLIQISGSGIAIIMVTMLGVKYMIASSNEKADVKKQAVPLVIGCVILFAAVNIVGIIADVGNGMN